MARKKYQGRPPKFVLDESGKEVYGLSYNKSNHMYYATFSDPRVYFTAKFTYGADDFLNSRIKNVVKEYRKWAQRQHLSPEQQKEEEELDRIYDKAKQLFKEGYLDKEVKDHIEQKAKGLLKSGYLSREDIESIAVSLLKAFLASQINLSWEKPSSKDLFGLDPKDNIYREIVALSLNDILSKFVTYQSIKKALSTNVDPEINSKIMKALENHLLKLTEDRISKGYYDEYIWDRACTLIKENPVGFSKKTGIKGIATLNLD